MTTAISSPTDAWLEFTSGERIFLQEGTATLGRAPTNRIVIATERVSRNHAVIHRNEEGAFILMDLGSSNGTFVNGQRVSRAVTLRDGWIIEVGLQKMTFRTPLSPGAESDSQEIAQVSCWLLALSATALGCHTPNEDLAFKTYESWTPRAERVVAKHRGQTMRTRGDGLLAFWPVQTADSRAETVGATLRALCTIQRQTELFRLSLHHGLVSLRPASTGDDAPFGPEVIFMAQLDRLASGVKVPVLLTEAARNALGDNFPTRRLGAGELLSYSGTQRFYTFAE